MPFGIVVDKVFIAKFIKFGVVGGTGVIVDFFFTWLCKEKFKWHKYLSNTIGFSIAASTNWILNRIWTFQSQNPEMLKEYADFLVISLVGLGINSLVLWILTDKLKINFYISKLGAIAVTTVWNFFANYLYTFA
ncbi:MAG: GtrA family protein [Salinivirgaceae bacterium]|nr:GtrA family protein [Salinivirgaceae bacterium]